jgi:D-arabinono-1,4-lactone oxidase
MLQATFTDGPGDIDETVDVTASAPDGDNVNILLDRYTQMFKVGDRITVQAGIHLGRDPNNPDSTWENSLLHQLHHSHGLAVNNLGGISHQTVGGFLSTGSSGGSLCHSVQENVYGLRFVDGMGNIFEVNRDDNLDEFNAALVSLGLLGILSTVTFEGIPKYNISGSQVGSVTSCAEVDIFDDDPTDGKRGLTTFFTEEEYARILWWPQRSSNVPEDRVQVWKAHRIEDSDDFERDPHHLFDNAEIMLLYSYLMCLIGNIDCMTTVHDLAADKERQFRVLAVEQLMEEFNMTEKNARILAGVFYLINHVFLHVVTGMVDDIEPILREALLPNITATAIKLLNQIDSSVTFHDHWYLGLPMDNTADDIIVPVMWTETWLPLRRAAEAMTALRDYFDSVEGKVTEHHRRLKRTGNNGWEIYAAKPSSVWLSMAYTSGQDAWVGGAFRIDPYWFIGTRGNFRELYRPFWLLLKRKGIPFRLHWGKSFPALDDSAFTAKELVEDQYSKIQDFRNLRKLKDPQGIFLNSYWCHWFGLQNC